MNVLDRILQLRQERGWSEYRLCQEANIPQSTVSSWYSKKSVPSIESLDKICRAFGITLSQFFAMERDTEQTINVTPDQYRLHVYSSRLKPDQREKLIVFFESL